MPRNLNPEIAAGDIVVVLYEISLSRNGIFFNIGEELLVIRVYDHGYDVKRKNSSDFYYIEDKVVMKREYWNEIRKVILNDAVRLLTQ